MAKKKSAIGTRAAARTAGRRGVVPQPQSQSQSQPLPLPLPMPQPQPMPRPVPLPLGSSLSIREVGERAAQLRALLAAGSAELDAGKLESIDTAGLQLLLAAAAAARRRGLELKLRDAAGVTSAAAQALGLQEQLAATAQIPP